MKFIRKNGRIIPIREGTALKVSRGIAAVGAGAEIARGVKKRKANPKQEIKTHAGLDALGLGLSVASGVVGAATFSSGLKGFLGGMIGGHALDAAGIGANIASVSGKGKFKARAKQAARQEGRNLIIGNAVFAAGVLAVPSNRARVVEYASKLVSFGRKALKL